jgi:hypothetical protein
MTVIDELAGDEGKTWHSFTSACAHARHTPPSLTDPGRDGDGPSAKDTISISRQMIPFSSMAPCRSAVRAAQDLGLHVRPLDPLASSEFLHVRNAFSRTPVCTRFSERNLPKDMVGRLYTGSHARSRSPPAVGHYPVHAPAYAHSDGSRYPGA